MADTRNAMSCRSRTEAGRPDDLRRQARPGGLIDDVGFGASSAFGGPCRRRTPSGWRPKGLKYNRFHTTALCSPTRRRC